MIGFRGYAQRDPLNEYKTESFELFQHLIANLRRAVTGQLAHVEIQQRPPEPPPPPVGVAHHINASTGEDDVAGVEPAVQRQPAKPANREAKDPSTWGKVGRNEPCPCGSGKKYKQCHGMVIA